MHVPLRHSMHDCCRTTAEGIGVARLQGRATDKQLTQGASLTKTGITTDRFTPLNAVIMSATVLLYLVIQVGTLYVPPFSSALQLVKKHYAWCVCTVAPAVVG